MEDDRIVDYAVYGVHIPLKCKNHLNKRWWTKNILYIGARSLFYNLHRVTGMGSECNCPITDLIPLTEKEVKEEGS